MSLFKSPITKAKRRVARATGIPTTHSGRTRKIKKATFGLGPSLFVIVGVLWFIGYMSEERSPTLVASSSPPSLVADVPSESGLIWDIDSETDFSLQEKEVIKQGASKVLADESNCLSIYTGYRSSSRDNTYYVTCAARNGGEDFNVFFTPEEIAIRADLSIPEPYPEIASREGCISAIESFAISPSTLSIHSILGYSTDVGNNGNRVINQEFSAQNLFGTEVEYVARCLVLPDGSLEFSANERIRN